MISGVLIKFSVIESYDLCFLGVMWREYCGVYDVPRCSTHTIFYIMVRLNVILISCCVLD